MKSSGARLGAAWERRFCKTLSLWYSGNSADDLFWRTPSSGGRATTRRRTNKAATTAAGTGDVAATDERAAVLVSRLYFELKSTRGKGTPFDHLLSARGLGGPWVPWLQAADVEARLAGRVAWFLVCERPRHAALLAMPRALWASLLRQIQRTEKPSAALVVSHPSWSLPPFVVLRLGDFFAYASPGQLDYALAELTSE